MLWNSKLLYWNHISGCWKDIKICSCVLLQKPTKSNPPTPTCPIALSYGNLLVTHNNATRASKHIWAETQHNAKYNQGLFQCFYLWLLIVKVIDTCLLLDIRAVQYKYMSISCFLPWWSSPHLSWLQCRKGPEKYSRMSMVDTCYVPQTPQVQIQELPVYTDPNLTPIQKILLLWFVFLLENILFVKMSYVAHCRKKRKGEIVIL